jgi:peroxiredoxin
MFAFLSSVLSMKMVTPLLGLALVGLRGLGPTTPDTIVDAQPLPAVDERVVPAALPTSPHDRGDGPTKAAYAAAVEAVRKSGVLERALHVGDKAVDFELNDAAGYRIQGSELWAVGPLVVVFYRGGWSPTCSSHLIEMQKALRAIHGEGGQLVALSPESPAEALVTRRRNKLTFPLLYDKANGVARRFGIVYRVSDSRRIGGQLAEMTPKERSVELPLAATYVIDSGGVIRYAFLDADPARRAEPPAVVGALRRLRSASPGMRSTPTVAARTAGR